MQTIYQYIFELENYLLLVRALKAARLVRRSLDDKNPSPKLSSAIAAVDKLYLPPQRNWNISDIEKIAAFTGFIINNPLNWGRCVQRALITYRLLNGYGVPANICFGIRKGSSENDGHAWVELADSPNRAFGESADPRTAFQIVYISPRPERKAEN